MYKKMFESMYNGSLVTKGPWEALVTFQQMIILADQFGVVDITPEVIARRTGIPFHIIEKGIEVLEQPDPESRNDELEGRRIDRLADHRSWGWRIVNFTYYDSLRRADERAAYQAAKYQERKSVKSRKSKTYKKVSTISTPVNNSTLSTPHTHSQSDLQSELQSQKKDIQSAAKAAACRVLAFLNEKAGKNFREVDTNIDIIMARLAGGVTEASLRGVVARKCRDWAEKPDMRQYLRPETLFGKTKCEQYLGEQGRVAP